MQTIHSVDDFLSRTSSQLADSMFPCPYCGETHTVPIKAIYIGDGIVRQVPEIIKKALEGCLPAKPGIIYDGAIESFVQDNIIEPVQSAGMRLIPVILRGKEGHLLEAEDKVGDAAADAMDPAIDFLIGAGSGVISDLTKWIATRLKKPFILVGTAASMNGHASITAAMTFNGIKETAYDLIPASAVVFDVNILKKAPLAMNLSGLADMTARNTCNADWKLSSLLRGVKDFCPLPYQMMIRAQEQMLGMTAGIARGESRALEALAESCLMSALTMTIMGGKTSPSSGVEHVISHFWDLMYETRGLPHHLHGVQVGIAEMIGLSLYEIVRSLDPAKVDPRQLLRKRKSLEQIDADNLAQYGPELAAHFNKVARQKRIPDEQYLSYVRGILDTWDKIWEQVAPFTASLDSIRKPLQAGGAYLKLSDIDRTKEHALETILNGNHYRPRYTILDLAWELGVLPDRAEEVLERSGVMA